MKEMHSTIYHVLNHSSHDQFMDGLKWYGQAREFAAETAQASGYPLITVCAVIAALSPMSPWDRNKLDAYEMCMGNLEHRFTTFGANVRKAERLLKLNDYDSIVTELNGLKTVAFFDNIFNPDSDSVTIDSHMLSLAHGEKLSKSDRPSMTKSMYHIIEDGIRSIADKFKLRPYELQAILWVTWRDI